MNKILNFFTFSFFVNVACTLGAFIAFFFGKVGIVEPVVFLFMSIISLFFIKTLDVISTLLSSNVDILNATIDKQILIENSIIDKIKKLENLSSKKEFNDPLKDDYFSQEKIEEIVKGFGLSMDDIKEVNVIPIPIPMNFDELKSDSNKAFDIMSGLSNNKMSLDKQIETLEKDMSKSIREEDFEKATRIKDEIERLKSLKEEEDKGGDKGGDKKN